MNPLVSVVIPVYNGSNYLQEAIDSVLNQTYQNIEIIVVDDGSTDNTWEIITSYGNKIYGIHKENGGVSTAINTAIKHMKGDWFTWLSHDDIWMPNMLEECISASNSHPEIKFFYANTYTMDHNKNIIAKKKSRWYPRSKGIRKMIIFGNYISGITFFINKKCFSEIGLFNSQLRCLQDAEMTLRLISKYSTYHIDKYLAMSRVHIQQVGLRHKKHCIRESREMRISFIKTTNSSILFSRANFSESKNIITGVYRIYAKLYCFILLVLIKLHILPINLLVSEIYHKVEKYRIINE
ncbi:Undecaprenyl-phosphate 4-deoxy-4-formamido-L-arabinose transferase [bioreactor metagenome]|uniref:Undecaprenyl-phosphate 4-deoxy-4-formamido-L-arabinose transferase n=1 Tax=bioreactor metagenome TaxID=1076179 RepID=A0A644VUL7_9ZZZZ